jgi:hypothetical protein
VKDDHKDDAKVFKEDVVKHAEIQKIEKEQN